ncbi:MAG: hypothetical protein GKR91_06475 [Pseudomonadales bacterium]|nr:hypothetical protein [Pseudomonadales bacterium]
MLYRRELFAEHGQRFDFPAWIDGIYNDTGEFVQRYCEEKGLKAEYLRRGDLAPLLWHFEGATLNLTRPGVPLKRKLRSWLFYKRTDIKAILADPSLDA